MIDDDFRVEVIGHATLRVQCGGHTLLTDPWLVDPIGNSGFHFPPLRHDPAALAAETDAIYISHIHPDHFIHDAGALLRGRYRSISAHTDARPFAMPFGGSASGRHRGAVSGTARGRRDRSGDRHSRARRCRECGVRLGDRHPRARLYALREQRLCPARRRNMPGCAITTPSTTRSSATRPASSFPIAFELRCAGEGSPARGGRGALVRSLAERRRGARAAGHHSIRQRDSLSRHRRPVEKRRVQLRDRSRRSACASAVWRRKSWVPAIAFGPTARSPA